MATDSPAYPPYFEHNKPSNGQGFESAVAYAVAAKLGYTRSQVKWVVEPFDASYAPGPKSFDFDINEISITPAARQGGDVLDSVLHQPAGDHRRVRTRRSPTPRRWPASRAPTSACRSGRRAWRRRLADQADQGAADVQHLQRCRRGVQDRSRQRDRRRPGNRVRADLASCRTRTIAGQFSAPGGDNWGLLMSKGSPLASCVDRAVSSLQLRRNAGQAGQALDRFGEQRARAALTAGQPHA